MAVSLSVGVEVTGGAGDADGPARGIAGLARRLESAGVSYWVIGADRGEFSGRSTNSLDPSLVATIAARHSAELGIVVAAAAHRDHPYNLARRLLSVDHAAQGRVGWLALDYDHGIALNAATDTWTRAALGASHTADAIAAVRTLWRTWPLESVVGDLSSGVFADTSRIKRADVSRGYEISGPLNVPGSSQGDLPVWQRAVPGIPSEGADLVVVEDGDPIPHDAPAVVRLRSVAAVDPALDRIARTRGVVGVLLRLAPHELDSVLDRVLPAARRRSVVDGPGEGTLRERLRLPSPAEPDLTGHPVAFDTVPNQGGRS
jgi:hypothetical protein